MATLLIAGVCFTWTARSNDDDKRRDGDRDKPREGQRDKPRIGDQRGSREREQDQEMRKFIEQAERTINELRKQGKHEEAEKLLRHVKSEMVKRHEHGEGREREREHGDREGGNEARMKHIGAAIEHLQAAGLRDWAEELAAHAREMNKERGHREAREDREEPEHRHEQHKHKHGEDDDGVDQLRREVNELRNALREIQKHLEKRR